MSDLHEAIDYYRNWWKWQLDFMAGDSSKIHRQIIITSMLDTFAQESSNYSRDNQKAFSDFLKSHCKRYNGILTSICPITLFYDCFDGTSEKLCLTQSRIYKADEKRVIDEGERLINLLPDKQKERARKRHSYAGLIYAMRNKLVHEFLWLNMPINFCEDEEEQIPHVACKSVMKSGKLQFDSWCLYIPYDFILNVANDAVENYLEYCLQNNHRPFDNDSRKCFKAWYDD